MALRPLGLCALVLSVLTGPRALATPVVSTESASVKVRPDAAPRPLTPIELVGAQNEFFSFQVVVHGGATGARKVRAQLTSLTGPSTLQDITLFRQTYLDIGRPSGSTGQPGLWPDGLVPETDELEGEPRNAFPFDVPAGQARAIWVDVHVPQTAPPGRYQGVVSVTAEGLSQTVPVGLEVLEVSLPSTSSLPSAFLVWPPHVCNAHTGLPDCGSLERRRELLSGYQRLALEHRITLSSFFVLGPVAGDWTDFDAAYAPLLEGETPGRLKGARMSAAQYMGTGQAADLSAWAQHFGEKGWGGLLYDYTGDEPPYGDTFADVRTRARLVKDNAPAMPTLLTSTVDALEANGLSESIDRLVVLVNFIDGSRPPYEGDQRSDYDAFVSSPGRSVWLYQSCMSHGCAYGTNVPESNGGAGWPSYMVDRSAAKNRAMQWLVFLERASGELYYQTVGMLSSAWTDQFRFNGNGDGTLFYPGTPARVGGQTDVPLPSIRLKLIRQGMQDYEWLRLVSEAGDPAYAHAVARQLIPRAFQVGDDGNAFDEARLKLIRRYLELRPPRRTVTAVPPPPLTPVLPVPQTVPGLSPAAPSEAAPSEAAPAEVEPSDAAQGEGLVDEPAAEACGCAEAGTPVGLAWLLLPVLVARRRARCRVTECHSATTGSL